MEAITLLREVVEEDPKHRDGLFYLGEFSRMSGQLDRALERYQTLLEYYPSDVEVATRYAETLHDLGRGPEALTFIETYTAEHSQSDVSGLTQLRDLWNEGDAEAPAGSTSLTH
jgi:tetratricopeptide (TPR) repeat protein